MNVTSMTVTEIRYCNPDYGTKFDNLAKSHLSLSEQQYIFQLLSYLKLSGSTVGLLINFNVKVLKNGVRRLVLGLQE